MSPTIASSSALAGRFHAHASEWQADTRFLAASSAASEHPAYRAIVALGPAVVPLILADLAVAPEPWFAALRELTGEDPVPPDERSRPRAAAAHWLAWGRARGLARPMLLAACGRASWAVTARSVTRRPAGWRRRCMTRWPHTSGVWPRDGRGPASSTSGSA